jgi:LacI family transcriptional regulator
MPEGNTSMRQRVTQSDVARVAGVHNTTVSLSLRNCHSIPEETRKRIRAIADEMGYYPDPTLQALVAYRKGCLSSRSKETLAYVTNWDTRFGWRAIPDHERAYVGAQRKADELGYKLEHFWLGEPGMSERRMSDVLYHRGIQGILVAAHMESNDELSKMDWSRLSAVKVGYYPREPALHQVTNDYCGMVRMAMRRAMAAGFERVGFFMAQWWDDAAAKSWSAGFLIEQNNIPSNTRVPILTSACDREEWVSGQPSRHSTGDTIAMAKWYQMYRPDVIIGFSPLVLAKIGLIGLVVPRHVAYLDLCVENANEGTAGVRQNGEIAGEVAASMLVAQIRQNLFGKPAVATSTLVDGTWRDGASMPTVSELAACAEMVDVREHIGEGMLQTTSP